MMKLQLVNSVVETQVRRRDKLMEEARQGILEPGSGRVMRLVRAFESLLTIGKSDGFTQNNEKKSEDDKKVLKSALPGLQPNAPETQVSSSLFCPSDFRATSPFNSSHGSISSRTSGGCRRSRRSRWKKKQLRTEVSIESTGTFGGSRWKKKQLKATTLKPFKLRTEQRGRQKQEEFIEKVQRMMIEEEKQRIPIAEGLPWTKDEPECLVKPPIKEITRPVDLVLHSDVWAVERSEFDQLVAEKMILVEQYKLERERQHSCQIGIHMLEEEEEIRRLRKELVPRAQPMPYFDRPFIPTRSMKHPTIPREPRFHVPQQKMIKC